ncbi:MAG TPA: hypothetical protein VHT52_12375, partial [Stellaceae bacterium]|nr:hypothetical protein [Stellaceae bacterium]
MRAYERVEVRPVGGGFKIELIGDIANMVVLSADGKKPGSVSAAGLVEQTRMVAGPVTTDSLRSPSPFR